MKKKNNCFGGYRSGDTHHDYPQGVEEWKLVFKPKNVALEWLLNETVKMLQLDGIVSVDTLEQMEDLTL